MESRLTLSREGRIQAGRDFRRLKESGRRLASGSLVLNWGPRPAGGLSRLGVITSRSVGSAVDRNRARRLIREAFRQQRPHLNQSVDLVLIARPSIRQASFSDVQRHLVRGLRQASLLVPGDSPS